MIPTCLSDVVDPCALRAARCPLPPRRDQIIPDWYSFQPGEDDDAYWTRIASQTKCVAGFGHAALPRLAHECDETHVVLPYHCLNASLRIA